MSDMQNNGSYLPPENGESKGALVGAIIVVILLIIGGIYVLTSKIGQAPDGGTATTTEETSDEILATSTDINDIEADLQGIDTTEIDAEIDTSLE